MRFVLLAFPSVFIEALDSQHMLATLERKSNIITTLLFKNIYTMTIEIPKSDSN